MTCIRCNGSGVQYYGPNPYQCTNCIGTHKYAGIGSRDTPNEIAAQMTQVASQLALRGWILRSGRGKPRVPPTPGTTSADLAFEAGADIINRRAKVIRGTTGGQAALDHAAQFHPNWAACSEYAKGLHARNSLIMLGDWLDDPVRVVVCWTPNGAVTGGTGQALRIAAAHDIPVVNLAVSPVAALWEIVG